MGLGLAAAQQTPSPSGQGDNLATPQQKADQEKAQQSEGGRAGTTEPSAQAPTPRPEETAAFINGKLAVPGAPADSQTVPAKFSERNATLDELPTMAFALKLTDDQRKRVRDALGKAPVTDTSVQLSQLLPASIEMGEVPSELTQEIPPMRNLGFVRTPDGILLVTKLQRIVVGQVTAPEAAN
jgi:hypothetical protein